MLEWLDKYKQKKTFFPFFTLHTKINLIYIIDLYVKVKMINFLEDNTSIDSCHWSRQIFFLRIKWLWTFLMDKSNFSTIKIFYSPEDTINEMQRQVTDWKKTLYIYIYIPTYTYTHIKYMRKGLTSRIYFKIFYEWITETQTGSLNEQKT